MGHKLNNKNREEQFPHKTLLIFSGVCLGSSLLFLHFLGVTLKILKTVEYNVFGFLVILVPFVSHLYIWGMYCEWKGIKALSIALKLFAILAGAIILIMTILYLCGAEITVTV